MELKNYSSNPSLMMVSKIIVPEFSRVGEVEFSCEAHIHFVPQGIGKWLLVSFIHCLAGKAGLTWRREPGGSSDSCSE
jgi:hypothetical protein